MPTEGFEPSTLGLKILCSATELRKRKGMIGFAGKRVIEQTIGQTLPEDFQTSEFLLEHGFIDKIVERKDMKTTLSTLIKLHKGGE